MKVDWDSIATKVEHAADDLEKATDLSKPAGKGAKPDQELSLLAEEVEDLYLRVREAATRAKREAKIGSLEAGSSAGAQAHDA